MEFGITDGLRKFLKWKPLPTAGEGADPFYCWDANRIDVGGRKLLVVANSANRFCAITRMTGAGWKKLESRLPELVVEALRLSGFSEDVIEAYLEAAGDAVLTKTHGRKSLGGLTEMGRVIFPEQVDMSYEFQPDLVEWFNLTFISHCATRIDYGFAVDRFAEDLCDRGIVGPNEMRSMCRGFERDRLEDRAVHATLRGDFNHLEWLMGKIAELDSEEPRPSWTPVVIQGGSEGPGSEETADRREPEDLCKEPTTAAGGCVKCGAEAQVSLGGTSYCRDCYNRLTEDLMQVPHVTNDKSSVVAFRDDGSAVEFAVERMLFPLGARWLAREVVSDGSRPDGYEGIEVETTIDPDVDQDEALSVLWEKTQQAVSHPSSSVEPRAHFRGQPVGGGCQVGDDVAYVNDGGWGLVGSNERGEMSIVIDGRRYTGEQFLQMMSHFDGWRLQWEFHDRGDDLPEPYDIRKDLEDRGLV